MSAHEDIDPSKVAIYIRWSTEDQSEGTTLQVQLDNCSQYVRSQGWAVSDDLILIDDGYTGANLNRPALTQLRQAVMQGQVACVVVFKLDRLSRSVMDMVNLVIGEWDGRCFVKSAREPIDTTTHAGRMFFYTLSSFGEWERATIKERTFAGKLRRAQTGHNPGMRPPYGYLWNEERRLEVVPHESEVVQRVFAQSVQGESCQRIADALNSSGVPTRTGGPWHAVLVSRILRNPLYTGVLAWGVYSMDSKRRSGKAKVRNDEPHSVHVGTCPAIIAPEDFERASALRAQRPRPGQGGGRAVSSPYLLTGLLWCAQCDHSVVARTEARAERRTYAYYRCNSAQGLGNRMCDSRAIRMELLDQIVISALLDRYGQEVTRRSFGETLLHHVQEELREAETTLAHLRKTMQKSKDKAKYARSLLLKQEISPEDYRQLVADLEDEKLRQLEQEQRLLQQITLHRSALKNKADIGAALAQMDKWAQLDIVQRKELLRKFLDRIEVIVPKGGGHLSLTLYWRDRERDTPTMQHTVQVPTVAEVCSASRRKRSASGDHD